MSRRGARPAHRRDVAANQPQEDRLGWVLAAILLVAVLVRLPGLFGGLWHDEVMYSRVFLDDPGKRSWLFWHDVHPPGYPVLLWLWSSLLGNHEAVLRLPNFLAGIGSLVIVWKLARRWLGDGVAVLTTAALALSPPHIWYSVENKANMLALALSTLAIWWFARAAEDRSSRWRLAGAALALLGALATHSFAVATAGTIVVWLGWRAWREPASRRPVLVAGAILFLVWLPIFLWKTLTQGQLLARSYLRPLDLGELYKLLLVWFPHGNTIRRISPYSRFAELLRQPWPYLIVDASCAVLLVLGLLVAFRGARPRKDAPGAPVDPWPYRLLLLWFLPPLAAGLVLSLLVPRFYIERNFLPLLPAFALLLALASRRPRQRRGRFLVGGAILGLSVAAVFSLLVVRAEQWTVYRPKPDWRGAAAWLEAEAAQRGRLAVVTTTPSLEAELYLDPSRSRRPEVFLTDGCTNQLPWLFLARRGGGSLWLVENETWTGCWVHARSHATTTGSLALGREKRFSNLILRELVAR